MMYPKGEKLQYNNTGYVLLAMIIEKVPGKGEHEISTFGRFAFREIAV